MLLSDGLLSSIWGRWCLIAWEVQKAASSHGSEMKLIKSQTSIRLQYKKYGLLQQFYEINKKIWYSDVCPCSGNTLPQHLHTVLYTHTHTYTWPMWTGTEVRYSAPTSAHPHSRPQQSHAKLICIYNNFPYAHCWSEGGRCVIKQWVI